LQAEQKGPEEKINKAFRRILCRKPSAKEIGILKEYYAEQLQLFQDKKLDAQKTLAVGETPVNKSLNLEESAALMKVVTTIYNMEEAITKS
jgi:hypothetical protein